jgi:hypothetical protein
MPGEYSTPERILQVKYPSRGAFHFFAHASPGTAGVDGGRRRKGLRQE